MVEVNCFVNLIDCVIDYVVDGESRLAIFGGIVWREVD